MSFDVAGFRMKMAALRLRMRLAASQAKWHLES
jgi:hypothetical protein